MYAFNPSPTYGRKLSAKATNCGLFAFAADFLFYDEHLGWALGLFALGLLLAIVLHQPHVQKSALGKVLLLAAGGLGFSMVEEPTILASGLYVITVTSLVLLPKMDSRDARHALPLVLQYFLLTGWLRIYQDNILLAYIRKRLHKLHGSPYGRMLRWVLPIFCTTGFILLFAQANPIMTRWFEKIDFRLPEISLWRIVFWLMVPSFCWALLRPRISRKAVNRSLNIQQPAQRFTLMGLLFNNQAIFTSLILFNILFLLQNVMDVMFIWSGIALPEGMTYAEYAHRGAYPLIVTALLAGFFILAAFKAETMPGKYVQGLIYSWVAQNIFLVGSSIARLLGYIAEYQLTYLRIAALIWMVLVAAGLLLIVARIAFRQSNRWLVNRNVVMLYTTLYLCCFINFGGVIAEYNLNFKNHDMYNGYPDIAYLEHFVGIASIPALVRLEANTQNYTDYITICRARERLQTLLNVDDWRAWTLRRHRIANIPFQPCDPLIPAQPNG